GQPDLERIGAWLGEHPEAGPAIQAAVTAPPRASYATPTNNGIHAFRYVNGAGAGRFVRYRWEPEAGVESLSAEEAAERGPDYLQEEILDRITSALAAFRLLVVLAEDGDPVDDPTA